MTFGDDCPSKFLRATGCSSPHVAAVQQAIRIVKFQSHTRAQAQSLFDSERRGSRQRFCLLLIRFPVADTNHAGPRKVDWLDGPWPRKIHNGPAAGSVRNPTVYVNSSIKLVAIRRCQRLDMLYRNSFYERREKCASVSNDSFKDPYTHPKEPI